MIGNARIYGGGNPLDRFIFTLPNGSAGRPNVDYNANYVYNQNGDTCVAFFTSGTLQVRTSGYIDAFLVGGGAAGRYVYSIDDETTYYSTQTAGGTTTAFEANAPGGSIPSTEWYGANGGNGGSGGGIAGAYGRDISPSYAGSNGGSAYAAVQGWANGGRGQGRSTRAFEESQGILFSGGGAAYKYWLDREYDRHAEAGTSDETGGNAPSGSAPANRGGGGAGGGTSNWVAAYGAGGGGGYTTLIDNYQVTTRSTYPIVIGAGGVSTGSRGVGGNGGSGVVLVRNHLNSDFSYDGTWNNNYSYNSDNDRCIALLGNGSLTFKKDNVIDIFLVGGGGGGAYRRSAAASGSSDYINGGNGGATSISTYSAPGGLGGNTYINGSGGSGGNGGSAGGSGTNSSLKDGAANGANTDGIGQMATEGYGYGTRAFNESNGMLFSGGGGGAQAYSYLSDHESSNWYGNGGAGGGGRGGNSLLHVSSVAGTPNTGSGGGAYATAGDNGYCARAGGGGSGYTKLYTNISVAGGTVWTATIGVGGLHASTTSGAYGDGGSGIILIRKHVN